MATEYFDAPEVEEVARQLINTIHGHLAEAKIKYLFRTGDWSTQKRETWGKAQRITGQQAFLTGLDFVITIHRDVWSQLTSEERMALVDHELSHCCRGDDDPNGNPTWYIQGHDVEDFIGIIRRHGLWRPALKKLHKAVQEHEQLTLFERVEFLLTGTEGITP